MKGKSSSGGPNGTLPEDFAVAVDAALESWASGDSSRRLWARDASLWTGTDEGSWLGWLDIVSSQISGIDRLRDVASMARDDRFSHLLLLGMGGSSLCPDVLRRTFGRIENFPELDVLDSTDPAQVAAVGDRIDPARTLFIVSSKSGSTLEPNIFKEYFFERVTEAVGSGRAGDRFIAITDPGSKLEATAGRDRFLGIYPGEPSIGGRYSALSNFGMVPAAAMGLDVGRFLAGADEMVRRCAADVAPRDNPGVVLGAILGVGAAHRRDKVTLLASPGVAALGAWLEQLLAESTGKQGKGLIPVDGERPGPPDIYGLDRLFIYLRLESEPDAGQDEAVARLESAGQPVVRIPIAGPYDLGREFFRWEIATAVAGSMLRINPFDQPDVEASKVATRTLTTRYEEVGAFPDESPLAEEDGLRLFTDPGNAAAIRRAVGENPSIAASLRALLDTIGAGDYFALLAYIEMNGAHDEHLQAIRHAVRDAKRVATCLGYGPRFLHSTGQAYKGGPNTGVFLQITRDDDRDLPVPGRKYSFGVVKAAQALGDFQVLVERKRRALRVHLGRDTAAGIRALRVMVEKALNG